MTPDIVMRHQLPILAKEYNACIQGIAQAGEEVKWWTEARKLAFSVACRAACGNLLTQEDVQYLYPLGVVHGDALFAQVRAPCICIMHLYHA